MHVWILIATNFMWVYLNIVFRQGREVPTCTYLVPNVESQQNDKYLPFLATTLLTLIIIVGIVCAFWFRHLESLRLVQSLEFLSRMIHTTILSDKLPFSIFLSLSWGF